MSYLANNEKAEKLHTAFWPRSSSNAYVGSMQRILQQLGAVVPVSRPRDLFQARRDLRRLRLDAIFLNWVDNQVVSENGCLSIRGCARYFWFLGLSHVFAKKVIFIRHNNFPHRTASKTRSRARKVVDIGERICSISFTHSGSHCTKRREYLPHPLYTRNLDIEATKLMVQEFLGIQGGYYIVFGRIARYKNIHSVVDAFPADRKLCVVGLPAEEDYVNELKLVSENRQNILVKDCYVSEELAAALVYHSDALIVSHGTTGSEVVSGSYFFAISQGVRVYAIETPFFIWLKSALNMPGLEIFPDLDSMASRIKQVLASDCRGAILERAEEEFGDEAIRRTILNALLPKTKS